VLESYILNMFLHISGQNKIVDKIIQYGKILWISFLDK